MVNPPTSNSIKKLLIQQSGGNTIKLFRLREKYFENIDIFHLPSPQKKKPLTEDEVRKSQLDYWLQNNEINIEAEDKHLPTGSRVNKGTN